MTTSGTGSVVCIIPARGGSKRLPRKNLKPFDGRPVILHSIAAARRAAVFDRIVVSTDDPEIADLAAASGAEIPFVRPADLSDDHTPTAPVVRHAVDALTAAGETIAAVCCLYATAPFVQPSDLRAGLRALRDHDVAFTFAATTFPFPVQRGFTLRDDGTAALLWPEHAGTRSQDLPEVYHDAGQFYWGSPAAFARHDAILGAPVRPILLPRHRVQDLDTQEDWVRAEAMFRALAASQPGDAAP